MITIPISSLIFRFHVWFFDFIFEIPISCFIFRFDVLRTSDWLKYWPITLSNAKAQQRQHVMRLGSTAPSHGHKSATKLPDTAQQRHLAKNNSDSMSYGSLYFFLVMPFCRSSKDGLFVFYSFYTAYRVNPSLIRYLHDSRVCFFIFKWSW